MVVQLASLEADQEQPLEVMTLKPPSPPFAPKSLPSELRL